MISWKFGVLVGELVVVLAFVTRHAWHQRPMPLTATGSGVSMSEAVISVNRESRSNMRNPPLCLIFRLRIRLWVIRIAYWSPAVRLWGGFSISYLFWSAVIFRTHGSSEPSWNFIDNCAYQIRRSWCHLRKYHDTGITTSSFVNRSGREVWGVSDSGMYARDQCSQIPDFRGSRLK